MGLSARETEILRGVAAAETAQETAARLWVTYATVKFHRANIMRKLDAKSAAECVAIAYEQGIFVPERSNTL